MSAPSNKWESMPYRRMGRSGLHLSAFSYGSWVTFGNQIDVRAAKECISTAYEAGVNFFDNAEVYADGKSEELMGQAIQELGLARDTYSVSSKVFWGGERPTQMGLSRKHIFDAAHAALKRLRVEYLDLFYCHRPDILTPVGETVWAMNDLMRQGKILYWGTSEWSAQAITEAHAFARENRLVGPAVEQPEYNLLNRTKVEGEFAPLYRDYGMGTTIWSPLASGVLTGKYNDGVPAQSRFNVPGYEWLKKRYDTPDGRARLEKVRKFTEIARKELGSEPAEIALAWCASNPHVSSVILGASTVDQLKRNLGAIPKIALITADVRARLDEIFDNAVAAPSTFRD